MNYSVNVTYEVNGDSGFSEYVGQMIHEALRENEDYIQDRIVLQSSHNYVIVVLWPFELKNPTPEFLTSNAEWQLYIEHLWQKLTKGDDDEDGTEEE